MKIIRYARVFIFLITVLFLANNAYPLGPLTSVCFSNNECPAGYFCAKPAGNCNGPGDCILQPDACILTLDPVCGCDGITYINADCAVVYGVNVDYEGTCVPPDCIDSDLDGFAVNGGGCGPVDCNDEDPFINPGASEIKHDCIDQDCNEYDLTIDITRAHYVRKKDLLRVEATSFFRNIANLNLEGYGPMILKEAGDYQFKWVITVRNAGGDPGIVTVCGFEGCETANTMVW